MSTSYKFTPIYGAINDGPVCALLQVENVRILLDCGWDDLLNPDLLTPLKDIAPTLNAILISHPDIYHMGGLPYIYSKFNCTAKTFIHADAYLNLSDNYLYRSKIAKFVMEDTYRSHLEGDETCIFMQKEVDTACSYFNEVVYNQREDIVYHGDSHIYVNAREAGHIVGGSIWDIQTEIDTIVYSMNINPYSDTLLREASYKPSSNVTVLITDTCQDMRETGGQSHKQKENLMYEKLCNLILNTLQDLHGNVLIPVDSAGRCLEVLMLVEKIFKDNNLDSYHAFFAMECSKEYRSHIAGIASNFRNLTSERYQAEDEGVTFKCIRFVEEIESVLNQGGNKVVVASMAGLETSLAQKLFMRWHSEKNNVLVFTCNPSPDTLAHRILYHLAVNEFSFNYCVKERLIGDELERKKEEIEEAKRRERQEAKKKLEEEKDDSDSDFEDDAFEDDVNAQLRRLRYDYVNDDIERDEYGVIWPKYESVLKKEDDSDDEGEDRMEDEEEEEEDYFKIVKEYKTITIAMRRYYFDFNGLSDYTSIHHVIREINPKHIICWHGATKSRDYLVDQLRRDKTYDVMVAENGRTVEVQNNHSVVRMTLDGSVLNSMALREIAGYKVGRVSGSVEIVEEPKLNHQMEEETSKKLAFVQRNTKCTLGPVYVRPKPLKLPEVCDILKRDKIDAVLQSNRVVVAKKNVVIKKENENLIVEGNLSTDFQRVHQLLSGEYLVIYSVC